jgi:hypothetical protein
VVGLTILLVLLVMAVEIRALSVGLARPGQDVAGGLAAVLLGVMIWQLATRPAGLGIVGWTAVDVEAGRSAQALVVVVLAVLLLASALHISLRRPAGSPAAARVVSSLGLIGSVGSAVTAYTCFVE